MAERRAAAEKRLDETDKAIIRELQNDGRLPYAQLGPRVGLSQAATRQRVNRLIESGVMEIVAVTDPAMLGLQYLSMLGITVDADAKEVAATISEIGGAVYVVITAGRFDLLVEVVTNSAEAFLDMVNDDIRPIPGVRTIEIFSYVQLVKQTYNWGTG